MKIGQAIMTGRVKKDLSQSEFAKIIGVTASYLSTVEKGSRSVNIKLLRKIAAALDVSLSSFLFSFLSETECKTEEDRVSFFKAKHIIDKMLVIITK